MRLIFSGVCILICLSISSQLSANSLNIADEIGYLDSLVSQWSKEKSRSPYYAYAIKDFYNERLTDVSKKMIVKKGFGAVIIRNGEVEKVTSWINQLNSQTEIPPIYIANIEEIFELPFKEKIVHPSYLDIICNSKDSTAYLMGIHHGSLLAEMGIDVIHFAKEPVNYTSVEWKKVALYVEGLKRQGLLFSLDLNYKILVHMVGFSNIIMLNDQSTESGKSLKKSRKKIRNQKNFEGLYLAAFKENTSADPKKNAFYEGTGIILLPENLDFNQMNTDSIHSNMKLIKKSVRRYFTVWRKVRQTKELERVRINEDSLYHAVKVQSIVLLKNQFNHVPIADLNEASFYTIFSDTERGVQARVLVDHYKTATHFNEDFLSLSIDSISKLIPANAHLLVDSEMLVDQPNFDALISIFERLQEERRIIFLQQGGLKKLTMLMGLNTLIWSPVKRESGLSDLVQMVFGAEKISGQLPIYLFKEFGVRGEIKESASRIDYNQFWKDQVNQRTLSKIDSIVSQSIQDKEIPGCQIMMVYKGQVVYDKSFGFLDYDSLISVKWNTVYDIASVTKTTVIAPLVMLEVENENISLQDKVAQYFPELEKTNKADINIKSLLYHQSGLKSYYPFWRNASYDSLKNLYLYKERKKGRRKSYDYFEINWEDSVNAWIGRSEFTILRNPDSTFGYLYSDLGFMLMKQIIERSSNNGIDVLADSLVFSPLGMDHTLYNAKYFVDPDHLAPTEDDLYFRKKMLKGEVHDKNAALLGGVAGHAGLFSNANDMAKYMQMMLQKGFYGGKQYFDSATVEKFTTKPEDSQRRALGWDKPNYTIGNTSKYASEESFGHSGFTGTLVWSDPKYELVYIFLSNRIHPNPQNYKLIENNTRTKIHDIMYESILSNDIIDRHDL
ncbi:MAG: serine hydrolase [Reichenbachiella sp.]